ncbi:exo-beta-N-acetylmuramidase NamZ family protein [Flavobacteriaceae bacterium LMO-SS05]
MRLTVFKNTVLLCVLIGISCGSKSKHDPSKEDMILRPSDSAQGKQVQDDKTVVVGANQTDLYLSLLNGKRVGIVANQTSVVFKNNEIATTSAKSRNDNYTHLVDSLLSLKINIIKVFSPEHGFRGTADAGEEVKDGFDTKTGLPLVSLYGDNKKPKPDQLKDIDVIVFDIQDVGVRFYTYISTLHYIMEACAEAKIPVIILDRPNPNGHYVDGPTLELQNKSFLGTHPIPLVHGMTIGEYAQMINGEHWLKNGVRCDISIIPVKNYTHQVSYSLPIRPSPNLPNDQAIALYPSLGLFEGTNINAGRGTEYQFQRYGAPFLDKTVFTFTYTPVENFGAKNPKHKGKLCYGEDLKSEKLNAEVSLKWLIKAYTNATDKSLVFNSANFTKHAGTDQLQKQIEAGLTETEIKATWKDGLERFKIIRKKYLIYK